MRLLALFSFALLAPACGAFAQAQAPRACPCELLIGDAPSTEQGPVDREGPDRLESLLEAGGSADAADLALVRAALRHVPPAHVAQLLEQHTRVLVVRGAVSEALPGLANAHPEGWPEGSTYDDVPGVFHPALNQVVIAVQGHEAEARSLPRGGLTLLHLMGHALDPSEHGGEGSGAAAFAAAIPGEAGLEPFYPHEAARRAAEVYAESYARLRAGDEQWFTLAPALRDYWREEPLGEWFVAPHSESEDETTWDTLRPTLAWIAPQGIPTRYTLQLRDALGRTQVVGDSVRDAFRREGKHLVFTPKTLTLEPGQRYTWRVEAKSASRHALSPWQRVRVSPDAGSKRVLLQGGLPLPSVHAKRHAARVGTKVAPGEATPKAAIQQGLSDRLR